MDDPFFTPPQLNEYVDSVIEHAQSLTPIQKARLTAAFAPRSSGNEYGEDFSLAIEVEEMLKMARALRKQVMVGNQVADGVGPREVKEAVSASNTLLNTLLKVHEQVMSFERQRAIEKAVTEAISELSHDHKQKFFTRLSELLEAV
jgi:hypothetical protein